MSKYSVLKGLTKLLPTGEKALIGESDDIIHALKALDERFIENAVSRQDAVSGASDVRQKLAEKLYPRDVMDYAERKSKLAEFRKKTDLEDRLPMLLARWDSPRTIGTYHFPKELDDHLNPEEIAKLSKQYKDTDTDMVKAFSERMAILRELEKNNPGFKYEQVEDDPHAIFDEVSKRFKNIKRQLKKSEKK